jgi:hypothetical protein
LCETPTSTTHRELVVKTTAVSVSAIYQWTRIGAQQVNSFGIIAATIVTAWLAILAIA